MTSREAFEKWFVSRAKLPLEMYGKWHEDEQRYTEFSALQTDWEAWQASRAALIAEIKRNGPLMWYEAEPLYRLPEGEV